MRRDLSAAEKLEILKVWEEEASKASLDSICKLAAKTKRNLEQMCGYIWKTVSTWSKCKASLEAFMQDMRLGKHGRKSSDMHGKPCYTT